MQSTLQFLIRVLPNEGLYVGIDYQNLTPQQFFVETTHELAQRCEEFQAVGRSISVGIASYNPTGNRTQESVRALKCFVVDIDCGVGKPYPSWVEGMAAYEAFLQTTGIPRGTVVSSGNGVHVYWVLTSELSLAQWKPLAITLKNAAIQCGFLIDPVPTGNAACVMRPVGVTNPKVGREVYVSEDAPPTEPHVIATALAPYIVAEPEVPKQEEALPLANGSVVSMKCKQIKAAVEKPAEVSEPLWYSVIGVAAFCQDPEKTAILWSQGHPEFDEAATRGKVKQWQSSTGGPTRCEKFASENPKGCDKCQFRGKIKSPAVLGIQFATVGPDPDAPDKLGGAMPVPTPFKRTLKGMAMAIDTTDILISPFDVYPVSYGFDDTVGHEVARFHWKRLHKGWVEMVLRQAFLVEGSREFGTAIADQGILLDTKKQTELFQMMLRRYINMLNSRVGMTSQYSSMGWKPKDKVFVLGNSVLSMGDNGVETKEVAFMRGTGLDGESYGSAGKGHVWGGLVDAMAKNDMHPHIFTLGVGLSAPLYRYTGLHGVVLSLYGPTGGGKTMAQFLAQSVFGAPDKLHFNAVYTKNSLFNRLGMHGNLPMTIDEVTLMDNKDVGEFCYTVTQGSDKVRLSRDAKEKKPKQWAAPVVVSTNVSLRSKLVSTGMDTDAQNARLLEIAVPNSGMFNEGTQTGKLIYTTLATNYGHIGKPFIEKLVEFGDDKVQELLLHYREAFHKEFDFTFTGEERYWEHAIIMAYTAFSMARDWDIMTVRFEPCIRNALNEIVSTRNEIVDTRQDYFDVLAAFIAEKSSEAVTVLYTGNNAPQVDMLSLPNRGVYIRVEAIRDTREELYGRGFLLIDRAYLNKWLATRGVDPRSFMFGLRDAVDDKNGKRHSLSKDTPIVKGNLYCTVFDLTHVRLSHMLNNSDWHVEKKSLNIRDKVVPLKR